MDVGDSEAANGMIWLGNYIKHLVGMVFVKFREVRQDLIGESKEEQSRIGSDRSRTRSDRRRPSGKGWPSRVEVRVCDDEWLDLKM